MASPLSVVLIATAALGGLAAGPVRGHAQVLTGTTEPVPEVTDSSDVLSRARREQARFEVRRSGLIPLNPWSGGGGGACEERVGRFCVWSGDDDWVPKPEGEAVQPLRDALVAYLDSVQALLPGDGWIQGQRVWYRVEADRWDDALEAARDCGAEPWWCDALRGLALHGLGRYSDAGEHFRTALASMERERALRWRDPRRLLPAGSPRALQRAGGGEGDGAVRPRPEVDLLWALADPLFLVPGNDRETEHYARWTVATLRERARNPFRISWGRDLEELTVRMGWEVGWERTRDAAGRESTVGHHHPEGRDFIPVGEALADPAGASGDAFVAGKIRTRSLHASREAPILLPTEGQVAVFPRGDSLVVVATHYLPADTGRDSSRDRDRPWMAPGPWDGEATRSGLFLLPLDGGGLLRHEGVGRNEGALLLPAPAGSYVVGVETWAPPLRRAGRYRAGVRRDPVPADVPTLSDLLLVQPGPAADPASLAEAAAGALVRPRIPRGEAVGVVWELRGVGWFPEEVRYELSAERVGVGPLRRLGQALRIVDRPRPLALSWSEPAPERPVPVLRRVQLALEGADPGMYRVELRARLAGRGVLVAQTHLAVEPAERREPMQH